MTLILTNDDGIAAPGIAALYQALRRVIDPTIPLLTLAPLHPHSGCGHQVTTDRPLTLHLDPHPDQPHRYALDGTPADCTRIALSQLPPRQEPSISLFQAALPTPTWVLSGINAGGNLGADIPISGTLAATREAAYHGIPAIAFSQYLKGRHQPIDWERASYWAGLVFLALQDRPLAPHHFWNVNFPWPTANGPDPELCFCSPCAAPHPLHYKQLASPALSPSPPLPQLQYAADYSQRPTSPDTDVSRCFNGAITISQLGVFS